MNVPRHFRLNEPLVASQEIDGEMVLINFDSGHYFAVNPSGSFIIRAVRRGVSVEAIAELIASRVGPTAGAGTEAVDGFVRTLVNNVLLVPMDPPATPVVPDDTALPVPFDQPAIERFEDLQDLLMLDPIHDVDQAGWPLPAPTDASAG